MNREWMGYKNQINNFFSMNEKLRRNVKKSIEREKKFFTRYTYCGWIHKMVEKINYDLDT